MKMSPGIDWLSSALSIPKALAADATCKGLEVEYRNNDTIANSLFAANEALQRHANAEGIQGWKHLNSFLVKHLKGSLYIL